MLKNVASKWHLHRVCAMDGASIRALLGSRTRRRRIMRVSARNWLIELGDW